MKFIISLTMLTILSQVLLTPITTQGKRLGLGYVNGEYVYDREDVAFIDYRVLDVENIQVIENNHGLVEPSLSKYLKIEYIHKITKQIF